MCECVLRLIESQIPVILCVQILNHRTYRQPVCLTICNLTKGRKLRKFITHNIICANLKTEPFFSLIFRTCNVWHKMLSRIYRTIRRHFKHFVDTLISVFIVLSMNKCWSIAVSLDTNVDSWYYCCEPKGNETYLLYFCVMTFYLLVPKYLSLSFKLLVIQKLQLKSLSCIIHALHYKLEWNYEFQFSTNVRGQH